MFTSNSSLLLTKYKGEDMTKPKHHVFVCASFRMNGTPQGVCCKGGSGQLMQYLEEELVDRGLGDVAVSSTGCLKVCDRGPALVVYPENWWFGHINSEEAVNAVIDSIEKGTPQAEYSIV
jgi:(2Fe-2S) ferredoxin